MYKISTLNKISRAGTSRFTDGYSVVDGTEGIEGSAGVLVRSQDMKEMQFDDELLAIARAGAGVNNIPLDRCADQGIVVFNTPGANANAVRELVIAAMLIAARNIDDAIEWEKGLIGDPSVTDVAKAVEKGKSKFAGTEIKGKSLGVMGTGAVGALVAAAAIDLGMTVYGYDPYLSVNAALRLDSRIRIITDPNRLVALSDYVTIHIPSLPSTNGMFNKALFDEFKEGAVLLNFSRDKLIAEEDLLAALESGRIKKYITDFATPGILGKPGVTCTPHLGASTREAEDNCAAMAADELMDYIENGNIRNSVNFPSLDLGAKTGTRVAVLTKDADDPVRLATKMLSGARIKAVKGASRGSYGYALCEVDGDIGTPEKTAGVTRIRVIR